MHDFERPTALVASILVNQNLDPKKNKPKSYEDMCFYRPADSSSRANSAYASAMLLMATRRKLPNWALFCFKEVTASADPTYTPKICGFVAKDALLLHPVQNGNGWDGMLIAMESASDQLRTFVADDGTEVELRVPHVHTKIIAEEGVTLFS